MKIKDILQKTIIELKENNIDEANSKARRLLAFLLKVPKEYLIINNEQELNNNQEIEYYKIITDLIRGKPLQYIIGKQEFMGIEFRVNENVLIPQPDTEILVEETIKIANKINNVEILDLCTGSGAIAISLMKNLPNAKITASDISKEALQIAKQNDRNNEIKFIESDLFENIKGKFDIIVSNPPYIKTKEISELSKDVQNEPILALDGGQDGLKFYKEIIKKAVNYLQSGGYLCLEIGNDQKYQVINLIEETGNYTEIKTYKDLNKNDRVIICLNNKQN